MVVGMQNSLLISILAALGGVFVVPLDLAKAEAVRELKKVAGKEWSLVSLKHDGKDIGLPPERKMTLNLDEGGKASGKSAVNRYFGRIEVDGKGGCKWGKEMGSTRMAGPPAMMDIERNFFQALPKTIALDLTDGALKFSSGDGKTVAVFSGKAAVPAGEFIEGQVVFKTEPSAAIPKGAKVKITLQDVSLADAPAKQLGNVVIEDAKKFPIKFKIPYSKEAIQRGRRYSISARIEDAKGLRFINDTAHSIFRDGKPPTDVVDLAVIKVK